MIPEMHKTCFVTPDTDLREHLHSLNQQLKAGQASPKCPTQCQTPLFQ